MLCLTEKEKEQRLCDLLPGEQLLFRYMVEGYTTGETAAALGLPVLAVYEQKQRILYALGCLDIAQLIEGYRGFCHEDAPDRL